MQEPALKFLTVGGPEAATGSVRRMAYWDWPCSDAASKHVTVCVHGLSRQGRDFDTLARALQPVSRVVAVDVAGRGHSDWLADPMGYLIPTYVTDLAQLLMALRAEVSGAVIDWVGTSMGGLIGMAVAAQPALAPRRLVLNDVGPAVQWAALQRIGNYLGAAPAFASDRLAVEYLASISTGFGPHSAEQWRALSEPMLRERGGLFHLHYDPAIAQPLKAMLASPDVAGMQRLVQAGEAALWQAYDAIACETLLLRGADSDLLSVETADAMAHRGPKARCVTFVGVGHAPTLVAADQVDAVRRFLFPSFEPGLH